MRQRLELEYELSVAVLGCAEDQPWTEGDDEDAGWGSW